MGKSKESLSAEVIAGRKEYIEYCKQHSPSVEKFRRTLLDKKLTKVFDDMIAPDGTLSKEWKDALRQFKKLQKLKVNGDVTYYVLSTNQRELYKFLIYYLRLEHDFRVYKTCKELESKGLPVDKDKVIRRTMYLTPILMFASAFTEYKINRPDDEVIGDGFGKLLVLYVTGAQVYGKSMELYASKIKEYCSMKNHLAEQVIILAEADFPEFNAEGFFPVIDLFSGNVKKSFNNAVTNNSSEPEQKEDSGVEER